jgi:hypothetical protein
MAVYLMKTEESYCPKEFSYKIVKDNDFLQTYRGSHA